MRVRLRGRGAYRGPNSAVLVDEPMDRLTSDRCAEHVGEILYSAVSRVLRIFCRGYFPCSVRYFVFPRFVVFVVLSKPCSLSQPLPAFGAYWFTAPVRRNFNLTFSGTKN